MDLGRASSSCEALHLHTGDPRFRAVSGSFPNVAVYLDDQSGQLPGESGRLRGRHPSVSRFLEGPQGTLFGAGAQAGVLRYSPTSRSSTSPKQRQCGLCLYQRRRQQQQRRRDDQPAVDTRYLGGARRHLQRILEAATSNNVPGTFSRSRRIIAFIMAAMRRAVRPEALWRGNVLGRCDTDVLRRAAGQVHRSTTTAWSPCDQSRHYQGVRVGALYKFNEDWNALWFSRTKT